VTIGSHTPCARCPPHAIAYNPPCGGEDRDVEFQVPRGLSEEHQDEPAALGFRVRTYVPVRDLVAGIADLVRRQPENTSDESFLHEQARGRSLEQLLAAP